MKQVIPKHKNCLIIGAGDLGARIAKNMYLQGFDVHTINRDIGKLSTAFTRHVLDLGSSTMQFDIPIVFDHVFFTAAPDTHTELSYQTIYIESLRQLQKVIDRASHFYFASSTGVYHQSHGEIVDETSATQPTRFSGRLLLQAEQWVQKNIKHHTIVRLSGLYSEERLRLLSILKNKQALDYARVSNRIHLADAAALFCHLSAIQNPEPIYIGSDSSPSTHWDIAKWYYQQKGQTWDAPAKPEASNKIISNAKILSSGFQFKYPSFKEGFQECL